MHHPTEGEEFFSLVFSMFAKKPEIDKSEVGEPELSWGEDRHGPEWRPEHQLLPGLP